MIRLIQIYAWTDFLASSHKADMSDTLFKSNGLKGLLGYVFFIVLLH